MVKLIYIAKIGRFWNETKIPMAITLQVNLVVLKNAFNGPLGNAVPRHLLI